MKLTITIDDVDIARWMERLEDMLMRCAPAPAPPPAPAVPLHEVLLTPEQAGQLLHLSPQTLATKRVYGDGPAYRKLGRRVFYPREALEAWMKEREFPHTAAYDYDGKGKRR